MVERPAQCRAVPDCACRSCSIACRTRAVDPSAVLVPRTLLERAGGPGLAVPDVRCREDVEILSHVAFTVPALGDAGGWNLRFGRELNATEDRHHFVRATIGGALPVVEGKQIAPFVVDVERSRFGIPRATGSHAARSRANVRQAAPCLPRRRRLDEPPHAHRGDRSCRNRDDPHALLFEGRSRHGRASVPVRHVQQFRGQLSRSLPRRHPCDHGHREQASDAAAWQTLASVRGDHVESSPASSRIPAIALAHARLQGAAAHAYGLSAAQFARVLETFPLDPSNRARRGAGGVWDIVRFARRQSS